MEVKMNNFKGIFLVVVPMLFFTHLGIAQEKTIVPDLKNIVGGEGWTIFNREAKVINENGQFSVYFKANPGRGGAWLENIEFNNGIIEADIKGTDVQGRSFVGIAFRGVNDTTYDAIYFRPFNFNSIDSVRKGHCVQYISHPDYPWYRLRNDFPEKYENAVNPVPDPDSFFHAKIIIEKPKISVYVNYSDDPCLVVQELTNRNGGWIGLWMGSNSDGTFANLKIIPRNN
jgi:hypothetical protein